MLQTRNYEKYSFLLKLQGDKLSISYDAADQIAVPFCSVAGQHRQIPFFSSKHHIIIIPLKHCVVLFFHVALLPDYVLYQKWDAESCLF